MSHIAEYKCELAGVDLNLLRFALESVAKELPGGKISDTVDSYSYSKNLKEWNGKKVFASIRSKNLPQGVGLHIDKNGKVHFLVNVNYVAETNSDYTKSSELRKKCQDEFNLVKTLLNIHYQTVAMVKVLSEMGYEIEETSKSEDGSFFMRAVEAVEA